MAFKDRITYAFMVLTILAFFGCMFGSYYHFKYYSALIDIDNPNIINEIKNSVPSFSTVHHDNHVIDWKNHHSVTDKRLLAIMNISNPKLSGNKRVEYLFFIKKYSYKYNLSPILVGAVIHRETNFRQHLTSSAGAKGCMQVLPKFHREKLKKYNLKEQDLFNIQYGINIGCMILDEYIQLEKGNIKRALCRYVGSFSHGKYYSADIFKMVKYANSIN